MDSARSRTLSLASAFTFDWLGRVRLRWLVAALTVAAMLPFLALATLHSRAAAVALLGALLIAAHGVFWLLVLRHKRVWLREHGLRW
jgi:hypothetical protein